MPLCTANCRAISSNSGVEGSTTLNDTLLYFTDGTAAGTNLVKAFHGHVDADGETSHWARELYAAGDRAVSCSSMLRT